MESLRKNGTFLCFVNIGSETQINHILLFFSFLIGLGNLDSIAIHRYYLGPLDIIARYIRNLGYKIFRNWGRVESVAADVLVSSVKI